MAAVVMLQQQHLLPLTIHRLYPEQFPDPEQFVLVAAIPIPLLQSQALLLIHGQHLPAGAELQQPIRSLQQQVQQAELLPSLRIIHAEQVLFKRSL
jgi:hypothetical protein